MPIYHYNPERCAELAVAVAEQARAEAAKGDPEAIAWIEQVRRDILDDAPAWAATAWAEACPPGELLREAYVAAYERGKSIHAASAAIGGMGNWRMAMELYREVMTRDQAA